MTDLIQFLADENPYGQLTADLDFSAALGNIVAELATLRIKGLTDEQLEQRLDQLLLVDGIAAKRRKDDPAPPAADYGKFMKGLFWYFKGKPVRVSKAVRLQYTVGGTAFNILIGFEGAGGGM